MVKNKKRDWGIRTDDEDIIMNMIKSLPKEERSKVVISWGFLRSKHFSSRKQVRALLEEHGTLTISYRP